MYLIELHCSVGWRAGPRQTDWRQARIPPGPDLTRVSVNHYTSQLDRAGRAGLRYTAATPTRPPVHLASRLPRPPGHPSTELATRPPHSPPLQPTAHHAQQLGQSLIQSIPVPPSYKLRLLPAHKHTFYRTLIESPKVLILRLIII